MAPRWTCSEHSATIGCRCLRLSSSGSQSSWPPLPRSSWPRMSGAGSGLASRGHQAASLRCLSRVTCGKYLSGTAAARREYACARTGERDRGRREDEGLFSQHASIVAPAAKRWVRGLPARAVSGFSSPPPGRGAAASPGPERRPSPGEARRPLCAPGREARGSSWPSRFRLVRPAAPARAESRRRRAH